ncbi:putative transposable element [Trichonephila clavipes]|nr:putative transposable element [Trichonephila clavipes]
MTSFDTRRWSKDFPHLAYCLAATTSTPDPGILSYSSFTCDAQWSSGSLLRFHITGSGSHFRAGFVEWAQNVIAVVPDFHKRILFNDEAHFWLNGYVNKQNCRIWSEANPQVYFETPLHPEKLTVWCALWAGGIIGPYFFKTD